MIPLHGNATVISSSGSHLFRKESGSLSSVAHEDHFLEPDDLQTKSKQISVTCVKQLPDGWLEDRRSIGSWRPLDVYERFQIFGDAN